MTQLEDTLDDPQSVVLRVRAASLEVTAGPDAGKRARVDRPVLVVGTGRAADLVLTDDTVSREHVRISLGEAGVRLVDEGSKNGTWTGTTRVADVTLTADTTITVGATTLALRIEPETTDIHLSARSRFGGAVGVSDSMRHVFSALERAAEADVAVLIEGEPGVGKQTLARAVHETSPRAAGPFVMVDCAALSPALLEDELFGHAKGAIEPEGDAREGALELARGGTLHLRDVDALPPELQPRVERALEAAGPAVRVVATTEHHASDLGEFRKSLLLRLSVARVRVPPLRDRLDDVLPIAEALLRMHTGDASSALPRDLAAMLTTYRWPGNVRELENVVLRYAALGARDREGLFGSGATRAMTPDGAALLNDLAMLPYHDARRHLLERFEQTYIESVLERAGGVVAKAAELAGVARPSFYRMVERQRERDRGPRSGRGKG